MPDTHVRPPTDRLWFFGIVGPGTRVLLRRVVGPHAGPRLHGVTVGLGPVDAGVSGPVAGRTRGADLGLLVLEVAMVGPSSQSPVGRTSLAHPHCPHKHTASC